MARLLHQSIPSPVGPLTAMVVVGGGCEALCMLEFGNPDRVSREREELAGHFGCEPEGARAGLHDEVERQLGAYFAGGLRAFDLPLETPGTEFQRGVWRALLEIPFGETCSYGELAGRVGSPGGQRAVGAANGANRVAIVVPCHRVIESTGKLRGYGGGLERKQWLLTHEGSWPAASSLFDASASAT
jgi:O-6-methylguanine DNA methyltransferase